MDCINDVIVTIDRDDRIILFANDAIETVFGYSVEDMVGKEVTVLMPERYRDSHRADLKRYVTTGVRTLNWKSTAVVGLHRSGAEIPLEVSYGEYARGGKRYFVGVMRDVSERKRAEDELRIRAQLAALTAAICLALVERTVLAEASSNVPRHSSPTWMRPLPASGP